MSHAYVSRAEAEAAPDAKLAKLMARAAYEADRPSGSSRPPFEETTAEWQSDAIRAQVAAINAARAAGWRIEAP